jgi:transposase
MDVAYKNESDANVKEMILLVRRFNSDGKEVAMICKEELHRSKAWVYKWLSRFQREGLKGLRKR